MGTKTAKTDDAKKAYTAFARWRKLKACLDSTGKPYVGQCITCGRRYHISYLQCGHAKGGKSNFILCNRFFTDAQCNYCNVIKHGEYAKFRKALIERHGIDFVVSLEFRHRTKRLQSCSIDWLKRVKRYQRWLKRDMAEYGYKTYQELLQATPEMYE